MQKENVLRKRNEKGARSKKANEGGKDMKDGEEEDEENEDMDMDMYEDEWDSEGLNGDGESEANELDEGQGTVGGEKHA